MSALKRSLIVLLLATLAAVPAVGGVAGAETSITTSNDSDDTETTSGDASASNSSAVQAGHNGGGSDEVSAGDVDNQSASNVQEGDNDVEGNQTATSRSGSAVGGQLIGAQTDGDLTVNATNSSDDVEVTTGDADSSNDFAAFVGLGAASSTTVAADVINGIATNVQEGDNSGAVTQDTTAVTGDGIAGQMLGAVTSGTATISLANVAEDVDATSGDSTESSDSSILAGLVATGIIDVS